MNGAEHLSKAERWDDVLMESWRRSLTESIRIARWPLIMQLAVLTICLTVQTLAIVYGD